MNENEITLGLMLIYLLIVLFCIFAYFLPSYLAFNKNHPNRWIIFIVNFIFGGTGIVWLICLVWALRKVHNPIDTHVRQTSSGGESGLNLFANDSPSPARTSSGDHPATESNTSNIDPIKRLEQLFELKSKGAITDEEYQKQKNITLSTSPPTLPTTVKERI